SGDRNTNQSVTRLNSAANQQIGRNPNYLGEILIYLGFALLACHWLPLVILGVFAALIFFPNMKKKDESLSRYPEFAAYKERSGMLLPKLFVGKAAETRETVELAND
ncbi:MAG: hypothetical protein AAGM29_17120, partial [Cyanobacteria bacterium J06588_4]